MTQPSNELERLQAEVDALRQAKASLEQQVGAVTKMMDAMVAEVSAKSRQLEERNAEQTRLGAFIDEPEKQDGHSEAPDALRQWAQGFHPSHHTGERRKKPRRAGGMTA